MQFKQWLESLNPQQMTANEMFDYVKNLHSEEEDLYTGDLGTRIFKYQLYILKTVPTKKIKGHWETYEPTVQDYANEFKAKNNYPPIVLTPSLIIIDGTHRYKALESLGIKEILAYVGQK